jgi:hypothetical protein
MKTFKNCEIPIDILGTAYVLHICPESKDPRFKDLNCSGFCDYSTKELFVSNYKDTGMPNANISVGNLPYIIKKAIRHELVHAFLYESGLGEDWEHKEFGQEETVVDWIARQLDKMYIAVQKIFQELDQYEEDI